MHLSRNGIGGGIIFGLTLLLAGVLFAGAEYLAARICDGIRYYPILQQKAGEIMEQCCRGAERMAGIPAEDSRKYLYEQLHLAGKYLEAKGAGMDTAVGSVKCCVAAVGMVIVTVVSAVLLLQERERIRVFIENRKFFKRIEDLSKELLRGAGAYVKAQMKIMGIISILCVAGLWITGTEHFLTLGILIGVLDMFPVLGTGTFLIPAGIIFLLQKKVYKGVGFFVLYVITAGIRQFLEPRLVGSHVGVPPILVLLSVYLGLFLYGGWGFLLGPLSGMLLWMILKEWVF